MNDEILMDDGMLEQICTVLDGVTTPDNELLMQIFTQFQDLHSKLPTFCFYLLHIISSDKFPSQRRLCALIVLNRNFRQLRNDLIGNFLSIAKPLLEEIIKLPFSPFTTISATMLCSMARLYGMEHFPGFFDHISELFTNADTVQVGLECFKELIQSNQKEGENEVIPENLLQLLPQIINSPYCRSALDVSYLLLIKNETFVYESILPAIFNFYTNFDEISLSLAAQISAYLYMHSPNEDIGNFLIECLNFNSTEVNDSILSELYDNKSFEIYPPLVERLLLLMELPDSDVTANGPCSMAQEILQIASNCHGSKFNTLVKKFISGHFTFLEELYNNIKNGCSVGDDQNVGFFLRCIYTILPNLREESEVTDLQSIEREFEVYYTIINGCFNSIFRGDAALAFMSFCGSNDTYVNEAFDRILPLFEDNDGGVKYQALESLNELVEYNTLVPKFEHFAFLIDLVKSTNDIYVARLANRYAQHLPVLRDSNEFVLNLYHELVNFFIATTIRINEEGQRNIGEIESINGRPDKNEGLKKFSFVTVATPIFQSLVDMLSLFVKVVVEPFELLDKRIFVSILFSIENDYFDTSMFSTYFELILSLFETYNDDILNAIESNSIGEFNFFNIIFAIFQKVVNILLFENDATLLLIKDGYSITSHILSSFVPIRIQFESGQIEQIQSIFEKFVEFSFDHLSLQNRDLDDSYEFTEPGETTALNVDICSLICKIMSLFIQKMNRDVAHSFLVKCYKVLSQFFSGVDRPGEIEGVIKDIELFGLELILYLSENNEQVSEEIYNFFMPTAAIENGNDGDS